MNIRESRVQQIQYTSKPRKPHSEIHRRAKRNDPSSLSGTQQSTRFTARLRGESQHRFELVKKNDNRCDRSKARFLRPAAMMSEMDGENWTVE